MAAVFLALTIDELEYYENSELATLKSFLRDNNLRLHVTKEQGKLIASDNSDHEFTPGWTKEHLSLGELISFDSIETAMFLIRDVSVDDVIKSGVKVPKEALHELTEKEYKSIMDRLSAVAIGGGAAPPAGLSARVKTLEKEVRELRDLVSKTKPPAPVTYTPSIQAEPGASGAASADAILTAFFQ